jgi:hypothetical protein
MTFPLMPAFVPSGRLTGVDLFATATSTASTITVPSSVQQGDLLVLIDAPTFTTGSTGSSPAGFTTLYSVAFTGWFNGVQASAKIADGADAGSTVTGMNGTVSNSKLMYVFRGDRLISSFAGLNSVGSITNGSSSTQTLSISGVSSPCLAICSASTNSAATVSFSSVSPAFDAFNNSVSRLCTGYRAVDFPTAPTAQNFSMNDFGSGNCLGGVWLNLT